MVPRLVVVWGEGLAAVVVALVVAEEWEVVLEGLVALVGLVALALVASLGESVNWN